MRKTSDHVAETAEPSIVNGDGAYEDTGWNAELSHALHEIISSGSDWDARFELELEALEQRHQGIVYSELIYLLSHLRIAPEDARVHWRKIVEHRASMEDRLGLAVDARVALVSYFMHVKQLLRNPKIIEMQLFEKTKACAYRDGLTGLRNYRFFSEFLPQEIARSEQYSAPVSLLMIDVDDFKAFNDAYGHEPANVALRTISDLSGSCIRKVDVLTRFGGEEFALILPSTPKDATALVGERIRETIDRHPFSVGGDRVGLTVSIGVATYPADASTADELVRNADTAMYQAKSDGKNRVRLYGNSLRSYRRSAETLGGTVSLAGPERHPVTTVNLSLGGMLFLTPKRLPEGGLVEVNLELPESDRKVMVSGRVLKIREHADGRFEVSIRTVEMNPSDRWALAQSLRRRNEARAREPATIQ